MSEKPKIKVVRAQLVISASGNSAIENTEVEEEARAEREKSLTLNVATQPVEAKPKAEEEEGWFPLKSRIKTLTWGFRFAWVILLLLNFARYYRRAHG